MKDPEEAMEKVLAGLRSTSAPIGMDRRIAKALEDHESVQSRRGWPWSPLGPAHPGATRFMKWSGGLAAVCAIAFLITANRRLSHVESPSKRSANSTAPSPAAVSGVTTNEGQVSPFRPGVRRMKPASSERKVRVWKTRVADSSNALAVEEMRAASHPPPPVPLTDQERLLLRIARKDDPVEIAELNPVVRAARWEEEKAEVQRFFKRARSGDNE